MRRSGLLAALTAVLVVLAVPASASAEVADSPCKPSPDGSYQWQAAISRNFGPWWDRDGIHNPQGGAGGAAQRALGAQFTGFGFDNSHYGWLVVYAPGALDGAAARAAIRAEMAVELTPDAIAFMDSTLRMIETKYSAADLAAVQAQIPAIIAETGWNLGGGIGCTTTGEWGLEITRYAVKQTPEVVAETEAKFAQFGDKVTLRYCDCVITPIAGAVPAPAPAPGAQPAPKPTAAPRVSDYVTRPTTRRCIKGPTLTVKAKRDAKSVRLTAGKRHAAGKRPRLKLKQRATRVTITVTLKDGRTASQTMTFRRC
jgi:hypothetical protein